MTFKKGDKVFVEFEVLDTCHSSDYMLVKDKSNQTRQFLKSEAQGCKIKGLGHSYHRGVKKGRMNGKGDLCKRNWNQYARQFKIQFHSNLPVCNEWTYSEDTCPFCSMRGVTTPLEYEGSRELETFDMNGNKAKCYCGTCKK